MSKTILDPDTSYYIGDFLVILSEETKELKVISTKNNANINIKPITSNSIILSTKK